MCAGFSIGCHLPGIVHKKSAAVKLKRFKVNYLLALWGADV